MTQQIEKERAALLPCPFCGGLPEFENTDERARLRCTGCGTEGGLFFFSQEECESGIGDETEARAVAAWNSRAPSAAPVGGVQMPLSDAEMLLSWMDETFGNDHGGDWADGDAAAVGDALQEAIENFKRIRAALASQDAAVHSIQTDKGDVHLAGDEASRTSGDAAGNAPGGEGRA